MQRYASFAGRSLKTVKWNTSIFTPVQKGLVCSSANFASDSKKKGSFGGGALRKNSNNTTKAPQAPLLNPATEKIVQIRENTTTSTPSSPPNPCPPPPINPCPPPPPQRQAPPPNNRNKALIALLLGAASIGGLYYAGVFDSGETKKIKPLFIEEQKKKWKPRKVIRNPPKKEDFPAKIPYVLVGGGTASFAAFRAIKSKDPTAKVLVIASEDSLPYMRPPLSKEIWQQNELPPAEKLIFKQWNGQERSLYYEPPEFYLGMAELETAPHGGVVVATGWVVSKIDANANTIEIEDPETNSCFCLEYEKCLIATGSRPKNLPIFEESPESVKRKLILYRNIRDLEDLWQRLEGASSVAIVGGGFLGSELACSLARKYKNTGTKVHQVFKESGNMGRVLPEYLSEWTTERIIEEGVNVIPAVEVKDTDISGDQVVLTLSNDHGVRADVVVIAVGSEANTQLAETSSLEVHPTFGGFLVNAELEARTNLYVAGDAACFYDPVLGRRRVEHHDHAVVSGRLAGENMAGAAKPYKHQSMFWSDLGHDVGYEAIGIVDSCLPTVAVFAKGVPENRTNRMDDVSEDTQKAAESTTPELKNVEHVKIKNVEYVKPENVDDDICKEDDNIETSVASTEMSVTEEVDTSVQVVTQETAGKSDDKDYNKGIIFYLRDNMIVGIILWNVFNRMHIARQILAERRKYEDLNEVAKLFSLHDD